MSKDRVRRVVTGRYGSAHLEQDAPEWVGQQVLEALGGPVGEGAPETEAALEAASAGSLVGTEVLAGAETGVWLDPDELYHQEVVSQDRAATADEPSDDESVAAEVWNGAPGYPEPAPGSGRRRRGRQVPDALNDGPEPVPGGVVSSAGTAEEPPAEMSEAVVSGPEPVPVSLSADPPTEHSPLAGAESPAAVALLRVSTGDLVEVRGDVVLGRAPQPLPGLSPQRGAATALVAVPSPTRTVSRSHLVLTVVAGHVLARDLGSGNGTVLVRPGIAPVMLVMGFPTPLAVGDLLDLGDGVTARLEPVAWPEREQSGTGTSEDE